MVQVVRNAPPVAARTVMAVISRGYARHLNLDMMDLRGGGFWDAA
jgi:hypothetical protein